MRDSTKVRLGRLYEKTSAKGTRYFVGRLGAARVLLFQSRETADDGGAIRDLYLQEVEETRPRPERPTDDGEPFHDDPLDDVLPFGG